MFLTIDQTNALIARGQPLVIAGARTALTALIPGPWIGGSIPYFITERGGCCDLDHLFVDQLRFPVSRWSIQAYSAATLEQIPAEAYDNGFSYVIMPANSHAHLEYAMCAPLYPGLYGKPILGWVSGVHLDHLASEQPVVIDGRRPRLLSDVALVLHVELPPTHRATVRTVNLFAPGPGPTLQFVEPGFAASRAMVNGRPTGLVRFMKEAGWDPTHPLVADYAGTHVNVSIKAIDEQANRVTFYAPVFPGVGYRQAAPVGDYEQALRTLVPANARPALSCQCVLNYVYGRLEGRHTGPFTGPVTFGEIAHQLVNQTIVYLDVTPAAA